MDAERQLMMGSNQYGSFVVREKTPGNYTLSIRDKEKVRHYRIKCHENGTFSVTPSVTFATIQTLVAYYKSQPHGLCVNLKHPCLLSVKPPTAGLSVQTNSEWEIDRRQIGLIKKLGVGQFGEVWKGVWNKTTQVAVKTLKPGTISAATFLREATQMKRLHHPNVIQLYAVCTREEPIYIVTELMTLGSLQNYLRGEGRSLKLPQLISMCSQIAGGMAHLESQNYVHHDLAAKNILVTDDLICKVDLSLARVTDEDAHKANTDVKFPVKWAAPEAAMYSEFTIKSDVWSFGMVLYEVIASDRFPYPGMTDAEVMRALQHGYSMTRVMKCPEKLHDIMLDCWKEDPDDRPNFETLQWKLEEFYS